MPKRIPEADRIARFTSEGYEFCGWVGEYTNNKTKASLRCPKGHLFTVTSNDFITGKRCKFCSGSGKRDMGFYRRALEAHGYSVASNIEDHSSASLSTEVSVVCSSGHVDTGTVGYYMERSGECHLCTKTKRRTVEDMRHDLARLGLSLEEIEQRRGVIKAHDKVKVRCAFGHVTKISPAQYLSRNRKCVQCTGNRRGITQAERDDQLKSIGLEVVRWVSPTGYRNPRSRVEVKGRCGHQWEASVNNLLRGTSCPRCSSGGFDKTKDGVLYGLLSEDEKILKVGITNDLSSRMRDLRRKTPFRFAIIATVNGYGDAIFSMEREALTTFQSAGLSGFSGATEWVKWTPEVHAWLLAHS